MVTPSVGGRRPGSAQRVVRFGCDPSGDLCHGGFSGQGKFQAGLEVERRPAIDIGDDLQVAFIGVGFLLDQQTQARIAGIALAGDAPRLGPRPCRDG